MEEKKQPVPLQVDFDTVIQQDFLGVNAVYHGFAWMPEVEARGFTDTDRQAEFDRVRLMGLNMARTWYRPDWACGDSLMNPFDWESPKMQAFYKWVEAMKDRGVDVALQGGWWLNGDRNADVYMGGTADQWQEYLPRFAEWVSESLRQLIVVRGYDHIKYLHHLVEPIHVYQEGRQPKDFWHNREWYREIVRSVNARLKADGTRDLVKTVASNSHFLNLRWVVDNLDAYTDIYSSHEYNQPGYQEWYSRLMDMQTVLAPTGKDFWLDEYGLQDPKRRELPFYAWYLAQAIAASVNAGNQTSQVWLLFDQAYPAPLDTSDGKDDWNKGIQRWGHVTFPHDNGEQANRARPSWYVLSMLCKYLGGRNNTTVHRTAGTDWLTVSATRPGGKAHSILVINHTKIEQQVNISLTGSRPDQLQRYCFKTEAPPAPGQTPDLLPPDKTITVNGSGFSDTLPPQGVAVYSDLDIK